MKKKITILGCMVLVASAAAVTGYKMYRNSKVLTLVDANIEALSNDEDAVKTKICYIDNSNGTFTSLKLFCNRDTDKDNDGMIYKCPQETMGRYIESSRDRCIK